MGVGGGQHTGRKRSQIKEDFEIQEQKRGTFANSIMQILINLYFVLAHAFFFPPPDV